MFGTQNTAQNILLGSGIQSFTGSVANLDGLDYYQLQVNNRANVSMSLSGLSGDVNLFLLDSISNQLAASSAFNITNSVAQDLSISSIQSNYDPTATLTIDPSFVSDINGWQDVAKVDFYLTNSLNKRVELADVNSFTSNNNSLTTAKFDYTADLSQLGLAAGNYNLNAIASDQSGTLSKNFRRSP